MKKLCLSVFVMCGLAVAFAPRAQAGTDMVIDNSAPAPAYNYAPPPPTVYYVPPPVVVYRPYHFYRPVRIVAYHYSRHGCWPHHRGW